MTANTWKSRHMFEKCFPYVNWKGLGHLNFLNLYFICLTKNPVHRYLFKALVVWEQRSLSLLRRTRAFITVTVSIIRTTKHTARSGTEDTENSRSASPTLQQPDLCSGDVNTPLVPSHNHCYQVNVANDLEHEHEQSSSQAQVFYLKSTNSWFCITGQLASFSLSCQRKQYKHQSTNEESESISPCRIEVATERLQQRRRLGHRRDNRQE